MHPLLAILSLTAFGVAGLFATYAIGDRLFPPPKR